MQVMGFPGYGIEDEGHIQIYLYLLFMLILILITNMADNSDLAAVEQISLVNASPFACPQNAMNVRGVLNDVRSQLFQLVNNRKADHGFTAILAFHLVAARAREDANLAVR